MTKSPANSSIDTLVDLACRDGVEIRPTLLRVLTDLYVQKPSHSAEEDAQYVELSLRLIDAVDQPTKSAVYSRLSSYPNAPAAVLQRLSGQPASKSSATETPTLRKTSEASDRNLAEEFFLANAEERRLILTNLAALGQPVPRRAAADVSEVIRRLETAALQRNSGEFARMLERALGISHSIAERVTRDNSGEPLLVAAKAFGMPTDVFQRILLFLNPAVGQSVERVFELSRLYQDIEPAAAERMVAIWHEASLTWPRHHAPLYSHDRKPGARAAMTPAEHRREPQGRDASTARFKNSG